MKLAAAQWQALACQPSPALYRVEVLSEMPDPAEMATYVCHERANYRLIPCWDAWWPTKADYYDMQEVNQPEVPFVTPDRDGAVRVAARLTARGDGHSYRVALGQRAWNGTRYIDEAQS